MTKKIIIGALVLSVAVFFGGMAMVSASEEEVKPYETMERFRGGDEKEKAKDLEMDKDEFLVYRNEARENHRQGRMEARQERLLAAVERGCITEEEMHEKMQKRGGRFSN